MSMSKIIESIEQESFSRVMKPPEDEFDGQVVIKLGWVICPYCMKKQFKINADTKIVKMPYKCKNSKCQRSLVVNVI